MPDADRLARIHRVREVQARLAQADEARARDKATAEANLRDRIAGLAAAVAPKPSIVSTAASLGAAAHFRERLQASAASAAARVQTAELALERSRAATRTALRDRTATEKLLERARADAVTRAAHAQHDAPGAASGARDRDRRRTRHDDC